MGFTISYAKDNEPTQSITKDLPLDQALEYFKTEVLESMGTDEEIQIYVWKESEE